MIERGDGFRDARGGVHLDERLKHHVGDGLADERHGVAVVVRLRLELVPVKAHLAPLLLGALGAVRLRLLAAVHPAAQDGVQLLLDALALLLLALEAVDQLGEEHLHLRLAALVSAGRGVAGHVVVAGRLAAGRAIASDIVSRRLSVAGRASLRDLAGHVVVTGRLAAGRAIASDIVGRRLSVASRASLRDLGVVGRRLSAGRALIAAVVERAAPEDALRRDDMPGWPLDARVAALPRRRLLRRLEAEALQLALVRDHVEEALHVVLHERSQRAEGGGADHLVLAALEDDGKLAVRDDDVVDLADADVVGEDVHVLLDVVRCFVARVAVVGHLDGGWLVLGGHLRARGVGGVRKAHGCGG